MSGLLDGTRARFDTRMTAHKGMLAHLGLNPSQEDAPRLFSELRNTLLACGSCHCPRTCLEWQENRGEGPPPWCHRRGTFLELIDACNRLQDRSAAGFDADQGQYI